jgi:hypothetical protein
VVSRASAAALFRVSAQVAPVGLAASAAKAAVAVGGAAPLGGVGLLLARLLGCGKAQMAVLSLALRTAPIAWQTTALVSARHQQKALSRTLAESQSDLRDRQLQYDELARRLAAAGKSLDQVRFAVEHREALAKSIPAADDPALYRWSEASAYVRLPKSFLKKLQLYDPALDQWP